MSKDKESPEMRRERMRQEELKNPSSSIHGSNLADLFGGLNWIGSGIILLLLIIGGVFFLLRSTSPLEFDTIASSENNESVVLELVNDGFLDARIVDVTVNDDETPTEAQLQIIDAGQEFSITDDYTIEEAQGYDLTNIDEVAINPDTSSEEEIVSAGDEMYAVSVIHSEEIYNVHIEYKYLWMTFNDTVYLNTY